MKNVKIDVRLTRSTAIDGCRHSRLPESNARRQRQKTSFEADSKVGIEMSLALIFFYDWRHED